MKLLALEKKKMETVQLQFTEAENKINVIELKWRKQDMESES